MTNSPPSNVNLDQAEQARVMAHGIDSLTLALSVHWHEEQTFETLEALKTLAKARSDDEPAEIEVCSEANSWNFVVKEHGSNGYEWILVGHELAMKIGNWREPKQRPSVMVDIRSETLWMHGPDKAVERVHELIESLGGEVLETKPSRVDLCVDVLIREEQWHIGLIDCFVTRARLIDPHFSSRVLSGFSIGRGDVSARLYDKPLEIKAKSNKVWMCDVWGIESVHDDHRIIRVEYQIRREALREFGMQSWNYLRVMHNAIWSYCVLSWLMLVEDASKHHTQQRLLAWWEVVQGGFGGFQNAEPLVRERSINADKRRLAAQAIGCLSSFASMDVAPDQLDTMTHTQRLELLGQALHESMQHAYIDSAEFTKRMKRKLAKHARNGPNFNDPLHNNSECDRI